MQPIKNNKQVKNIARKLPEYTIGGTLFTVDARIYEFRETAEPWNSISMDDFWEEAPTNILFDTAQKKIYEGDVSSGNRPPQVVMITVPPIMELDPIGLARHYQMPDESFLPKDKKKAAEIIAASRIEPVRKKSKSRRI